MNWQQQEKSGNSGKAALKRFAVACRDGSLHPSPLLSGKKARRGGLYCHPSQIFLARLWACLCCLALLLASGCVRQRSELGQHLLADQRPRLDEAGIARVYHVGCPDVLQVISSEQPKLSGTYAVEADGRLTLTAEIRPRAEGRTLAEIAAQIAGFTGVPAETVAVQVADFRSQHVYLLGKVKDSNRAVPYQGPETVLDLLQRAGGITEGAEPDDVYVIRSHLNDGKRPAVIHVNLRAIVLRGDNSTNIRLQPFDQVYVGETRRSQIERCMPSWLRPVFQALYNSRPPRRSQRTRSHSSDRQPAHSVQPGGDT